MQHISQIPDLSGHTTEYLKDKLIDMHAFVFRKYPWYIKIMDWFREKPRYTPEDIWFMERIMVELDKRGVSVSFGEELSFNEK